MDVRAVRVGDCVVADGVGRVVVGGWRGCGDGVAPRAGDLRAVVGAAEPERREVVPGAARRLLRTGIIGLEDRAAKGVEQLELERNQVGVEGFAGLAYTIEPGALGKITARNLLLWRSARCDDLRWSGYSTLILLDVYPVAIPMETEASVISVS